MRLGSSGSTSAARTTLSELRQVPIPRVHFTTTAAGAGAIDREALQLVDVCERALREQHGRFVLTSDPRTADFIVLIEPPRHKFAPYAAVLSQHPLVPRFAERCFAYDWADGPAGFLPGVYPSLRRRQWNPGRLVPGGFLRPYNEAVMAAALDGRRASAPALLMSFRGAASHPVRERLSRTRSLVGDAAVDFSLSREWFTHSEEQKKDHVERLLSAKFALCPRGVGPATFRTYEAMALGRAPVIVSDEWIAPEGPDWSTFALVISESRIDQLAAIVREREQEWRQMGDAAYEAWRNHFAPPAGVTRVVEAIERISLARARGETLQELQARWSSREFRTANGWGLRQRAGRLLTSSKARARLRARVVAPRWRLADR